MVLMSASDQGVASAFDGLAGSAQDREFMVGEGPGIDAFHQGRVVVVDDVDDARDRWPRFVDSVAALGVRAVYALPLQVGGVKFGVLVLYRNRCGPLAATEISDVLTIAEASTAMILDMQAGVASESLAWSLEIDDFRIGVHQATGMISVQLGCGVEEALVRLRAHCFATGRSVNDVAADVVAGAVRFDDP